MAFTIQSFPGPIPSPGTTATPAPISTTAPNPYKLDPMFANATAQSPLQTDKFVPVNTAPTVLPAACVVPVSVLPATGAHLSEVTETYFESDMLYGWNGSSRYSTNHYYLDGVGEVCAIENEHRFGLDDFAGWMGGSDRSYSSSDDTYATYITAASLQAAMARTRSFANALPAASHALTAAVIATTRLRHHTHRPLHASAAVMRMLPPAPPGG
jgi:hypothetical protein